MKQKSKSKIPIQEPQDRAEYRGKLKGFQKNVIDSDRVEYEEKLERFNQNVTYPDRAIIGEKLERFNQYIKQDRKKHEKDVGKFLYSLNKKYQPKKGLSRLLIAGGMAAGMAAGIGISGLNGCASTKFYVEPRLGVVFPVSEEGKIEQAYDPSLTIGFAGGVHLEEIASGAEVDAHVFGSSKEYTEPVAATVKTGSILLGTNVSISPLSLILDQIPKLNPELVFGIDALVEGTKIEIPSFNVSEEILSIMFGLTFGIGATLWDRIHARISYTGLPATKNVSGFFQFEVGYRFIFGEPIWSTE